MRTLFTWLLLLLTCTVGTCASLGNPGVMARTSKATGGSAPDAPTSFAIDLVTDNPTIDLTWTDPAGSGFGIEIWRAVDGGSFAYRTNQTEGTELSISFDEQVGDGHVYEFKVRATNAFGASAFTASRTNDVFVDAVEYYRMEESAGSSRTATVDSGGFGSMTEQGGTVTQNGSGANNNCAAFTSAAGHSFKSTSASGNTVFASDFTIVLWLYVTSLPATSTDIVVREAIDDVNLALNSSGNLTWQPTEDWFPSSCIVSLGALNAWHCVVLILDDPSDAYISIDGGTFVANGSYPGPPSGDDFLYICPPFGGLLSLDGRVDELAIWPRALSQAEAVSIATGRFK